MNRAIIIIGNQGSSKNFLPGVSKDVSGYKEFFLSNPGGAWENHEIHDRLDWTKATLKARIDYLKNIGVEYFLIVFTGHGYSKANGDIYLELASNEDLALKDLQNWLQYKRSLIITDSCRVVIPIIEKAQVQAQLRLFSGRIGVQRYKYRNLYDDYLRRLELCHSTIITSANHNECADDTDEGGLYSKCLLDCADQIIKQNNVGITSIGSIHENVARLVCIKSGGKQHPQKYSSSTVTPPFVVIPSRY